MKELAIKTPYIELNQALKLIGYISTGGEAKWFIEENSIKVNGLDENRRGRKLYNGDILKINKHEYLIKNVY